MKHTLYTVYVLECENGALYTGITTDVARRFKEHTTGKGGHFTRTYAVKRIVYTEEQPTRSAALKREMAIKRLSRAQKLELVHQR
jgi:putative endonuclease